MRVEPRVAFFPDSFAEVNGVAHTSRQFVAFAEQRNLPLLCVHGGGRTERVVEGAVTKLSLRRGNIGFRLEADFRYDLFFWRHANRMIEAAREFKANVVHVTGPNDTGQLGAYVARKLRLPLVISWHTNVHEYAPRRLNKLAAPLPDACRERLASFAERQSLRVALRFCRLGRALLAPNAELRELLTRETGRPTHLMRRGVDTSLFSPVKRRLVERLPDSRVIFTRDLPVLFANGFAAFNVFLNAVAALATAISLLIILLTTYTTVTERTRQIGILKALGASKRFIAMVFIKESMLVSAIGVAGGLLISLLARPALTSWAGLKIEIEIGYTLCAALGGLASGLMGAIYPALRAAGQDPLEALNYK